MYSETIYFSYIFQSGNIYFIFQHVFKGSKHPTKITEYASICNMIQHNAFFYRPLCKLLLWKCLLSNEPTIYLSRKWIKKQLEKTLMYSKISILVILIQPISRVHISKNELGCSKN